MAAKAPAAGRKSTRANKARARQLKSDGWTLQAIADELGVAVGTVHTWVGRSRRRPDALDREVFLEFLTLHTTSDETGAILLNRKPILDEAHKRAFYRWREEDTCPSHRAAEEFLQRLGLSITADFEAWAESEGKWIWACPAPPAGYGDDDDAWWLDLQAPYADECDELAPLADRLAWQREALRDAAKHDFELPDGVILHPKAEALLKRERRHRGARRQISRSPKRELVGPA